MENIMHNNIFNNKTILITGGTGSFGKMFTKIVLSKHNPKKLIIFSRDEFKQYEMQKEFNNDEILRFFIGDVRDKNRLCRAFEGVDYVVHAAALKHVPTAEYNPFEVIKTNVVGAQNVIDVSMDKGVKKVIALSTDKAASPINLYGASKLCSEKLFIAGNNYVGPKATRFSVVRYGNVIGSRGSVIPLFLQLRDKGVLTVTDSRMTRFWITLQQGVDLVLNAFNSMKGGEIFIPKIPSANIMDIAKAVAPECKIEITGIRPGEKLHEVLITEDDCKKTLEYPDYFVIQQNWLDKRHKKNGGKPVKSNFVYASNKNSKILSVTEIRKLIEEYCREEVKPQNNYDILRQANG